MAELKLISADSHVDEPGDLWVERVEKSFRERAPRIVENPPGQGPGAYLILEGMPPIQASLYWSFILESKHHGVRRQQHYGVYRCGIGSALPR